MVDSKNVIQTLIQVSGPRHHLIIWAILFFFIFFVIWSCFFKVDEIVFAEGTVIPISKIQAIQSLEGGIIKKIFVQEGQIVQKDQNLVLIDDTQSVSLYREQYTRAQYLKLKIARLQAEVNHTTFSPSEDLVKELPEQINSEKIQFDSRKRELNNMNSQKGLLIQELNMNKSLIASGAVSKAELLRLEQSVDEISTKIHKFHSDTIDNLNKSKSELARIEEVLVGLKYRVGITTLKSPMKGIVKNIYINTIGGVVKPGGEIMDIVPLGDTLLIEAKVKPNDIGFLHPGLDALVKITAYDYYTYGGLEGKLIQISADSTTTEKNEIFYKVYIQTNRNYLGTPEKPLTIIPGMVATVDIISGRKTIMSYLLKPILRIHAKALHEE